MKTFVRYALRVFLGVMILGGSYFGWQWWVSRNARPLPAGIVFGNGRIEAVQVDIAAKYVGRVQQIFVHEGSVAGADGYARVGRRIGPSRGSFCGIADGD